MVFDGDPNSRPMPLLEKCILGNVVCDLDLCTHDLENVKSIT